MGVFRGVLPPKEVTMSDQHRKVKQSVYLPEDMLTQLRAEAERLERPLSWVLNRAWRIASPSIAAIPDA